VSRYTGYLSKQGHFMKTWTKRYFVLDGGFLRYYEKKGVPSEKGSIEVSTGLSVTYPYDNSDILIFLRYNLLLIVIVWKTKNISDI